MQRFLFSCGLLLTSLYAMSEPVDFASALKKASSVLKGKNLQTIENASYAKSRGENALSNPAFYAFNSSDGDGFVLISGEDVLPEVIGYSNSGSFSGENMP